MQLADFHPRGFCYYVQIYYLYTFFCNSLCLAGWVLIRYTKLYPLFRCQVARQQSTNCADGVIEAGQPKSCGAILAGSQNVFPIWREGDTSHVSFMYSAIPSRAKS